MDFCSLNFLPRPFIFFRLWPKQFERGCRPFYFNQFNFLFSLQAHHQALVLYNDFTAYYNQGRCCVVFSRTPLDHTGPHDTTLGLVWVLPVIIINCGILNWKHFGCYIKYVSLLANLAINLDRTFDYFQNKTLSFFWLSPLLPLC